MALDEAECGEVDNVNFKMEIRTLAQGVPVIELEGEVDVYTAPQLKQQVISVLESGAKELVVDLTKVDYLDSTALGVLIGGLKRMREVEGNYDAGLSESSNSPRI